MFVAEHSPSPNPGATQANRPEHTTESLGTQVIEGVVAEGKETTTTFPVGFMGNDRPMVRDGVSVFARSQNNGVFEAVRPAHGRIHDAPAEHRLLRANPALFRVPADYQVVDEKGDRVEIKITRP